MKRFAAAWLLLVPALTAFAFDLQGHRGTRGLAPENTLAAFDKAMSIGVTTLELDIAITADGVAVISHDPYLNPAIARDASGQWPAARGPLIRSLTLAELKQWQLGRINPASSYAKQFPEQVPQDGERVPTLAELFERVKARKANDVRFNIEIKTDPKRPDDTVAPEVFVEKILAVVNAAGMTQRVTIQSFDWRGLKLVHKADPAIPTSCLTTQSANNDNTRDTDWTAGLRIADYGNVPAMVKAAGCTAWSPSGYNVTAALVKQSHTLGLVVLPWTINNVADLKNILDMDVDGIITDYPDRLRALLVQRGIPVPAPIP